MIQPHIREGVEGHAIPIVLLSEGSHVDRAMFNCLAHILYDRPCETAEEIDEVWSQQVDSEREILSLLKSVKKPVGAEKRLFKLVEITEE